MAEHKDQIPGGLADKRQPKDYNEESLYHGIVVELEHTDDVDLAREIAMDHLEEDGDYYVKLAEVEKSESPSWRWRIKKGRKLARRMKFQGLDVSIETDKGQLRHWYNPHNKEEGTTKMTYPYGYIRRTEGADDEHIDVYVGPNDDSEKVFIVHQKKAPDFDRYDEDKVMLGFDTSREAKAAYLMHYNSPKFFDSMTQTNIDAFKRTFVNKSLSEQEEVELLIRSFHSADADLRKGILDKLMDVWEKIKTRFKRKEKEEELDLDDLEEVATPPPTPAEKKPTKPPPTPVPKPRKRWKWNPGGEPCRTGVCPKLDGVEVDIDKEFPYVREATGMGMNGPPAHGNCRCTLVFISPKGKEIEPKFETTPKARSEIRPGKPATKEELERPTTTVQDYYGDKTKPPVMEWISPGLFHATTNAGVDVRIQNAEEGGKKVPGWDVFERDSNKQIAWRARSKARAFDAAEAVTSGVTVSKKSLDPMTQDEQDMVPMMPVPPAMQQASMMMPMIDPHDVETYEGVASLLNRIATVPDQELMQIASKIWGDGYMFEGAPPEQARSEILGFLLDQRDLLGIEPVPDSLQPSQNLLNSTPPGQSSSQPSPLSGNSLSGNTVPPPEQSY